MLVTHMTIYNTFSTKLSLCMYLLAVSAAPEERLSAESPGSLLQGAAGSAGAEGKTFIQAHVLTHVSRPANTYLIQSFHRSLDLLC